MVFHVVAGSAFSYAPVIEAFLGNILQIELFEGDWLEPAADAISALGDKPGTVTE